MKNRRPTLAIPALLLALCLAGCVRHDEPDLCPSAARGGVPITLSIGDGEEVQVRSSCAAHTNERIISDAYVLLFDGVTGTYKSGEKIDLGNIRYNGSAKPRLITSLDFNVGDTIVVLLNTGADYDNDKNPIRLAIGSSTRSKINTCFPVIMEYTPTDDPSVFSIGDGDGLLPMSGEQAVAAEKQIKPIEIRRAVAKVNVVTDPQLVDRTGLFSSDSKIDFILSNNPQMLALYTPDPDTICRLPMNSFFSYRNVNVTEELWVEVPEAKDTPPLRSFYTPEYNSALFGAGTSLKATDFYYLRVCALLRVKSGAETHYYRLDFFDRTQGRFIDLHRNNHYTFTISQVMSAGYTTLKEAEENPGSNLEYTITVSDPRWETTTSNGQYAVNVSRETVYLTEEVKSAELLTFDFDIPGELAYQANITTRRVSLVGADSTKLVETSLMQLLDAGGEPVKDNTLNLSGMEFPEDGYRLGYDIGSSDFSSLDVMYVRIDLGNIRHFVPVIPCVL